MQTEKGQEIEAKFLVRDLKSVAAKLRASGARQSRARVFESNLRFDTPDGTLSAGKRALRLRQDHQTRLTYKGPPDPSSEANAREEIEFAVSDQDAARRLFLALGYQVFAVYEKYRTTWEWDGLEVVLDELPFGLFVEIEGGDAAAIRHAAELLELDWSARCPASYLELFARVRAAGCPAEQLTFQACEGHEITPAQLRLRYADR